MITDKDVSYVADLANLELTDQERQRMLRDLNSILEYIDRLNELDTSSVPPIAQTLPPAVEATREDELQPCLPREDGLRNAPGSDGEFFRVPKVIEK
ncbi:MAG TPA: Asp-tRNA(Asn)/Glu-tRNA(Gln) amidotransferase subunit GatC [Candidatus Angelobacter sp.]|nr:Asp-tRNA(Asn)/Glu-tRNA(Gln) amidotransferase subunit GatC [Candidatus Angelobacter sp.]